MYRCPVCGDCLVSVSSLRRHFVTFHLSNRCPLCDFEGNEEEMKEHFRKKHKELYYLVYEDLSKREVQKQNKKLKVKESALLYQCPFCKRRFSSFFRLRRHALMMHKNSHCPVCKKKFDNIDAHLLLISREDEEHRPYFLLLHRKGLSRRNKQFKEYLEMGYADHFLVRE